MAGNGEMIYPNYIGEEPQQITEAHREKFPNMPKNTDVCGWYRLLEDAVKNVQASATGIAMCGELCKGRCGGIRIACIKEVKQTLNS